MENVENEIKIMKESPKAGSFKVGALEGASSETSEQKENLFWTLRTKFIQEDKMPEPEATQMAAKQSGWSPEKVGGEQIRMEGAEAEALRQSIRRKGN